MIECMAECVMDDDGVNWRSSEYRRRSGVLWLQCGCHNRRRTKVDLSLSLVRRQKLPSLSVQTLEKFANLSQRLKEGMNIIN